MGRKERSVVEEASVRSSKSLDLVAQVCMYLGIWGVFGILNKYFVPCHFFLGGGMNPINLSSHSL